MDKEEVVITIKTVGSELFNLTGLTEDEAVLAFESGVLNKLVEIKLQNKAELFGTVEVNF